MMRFDIIKILEGDIIMVKNLSKKQKRAIIVLLVIVVVIPSVFKLGGNICVGQLDESDVSEYYIYTPTGVPKEYKQRFIGVDSYAHWIFKLNKEEQILVTEDIESGKWVEATEDDIHYIREYTQGFLPFYIDFNDCYVVYYDFNEDKILNDYKLVFGPDDYSTQTMIHVYDTQTHLYYCAYWTM